MTAGDDRLIAALVAEHAAIFGYGPVGARLDAASVNELAVQAEAAHRARRDALVVRLASKGIVPPPADLSYVLPFPVIDHASAVKLALQIEERTGVIWRLALPDTNGEERKLALDALTDCAVRAVKPRRAAGQSPATIPYPGRQ